MHHARRRALTSRMYGRLRTCPTPGICRKKVRMTGKKSLLAREMFSRLWWRRQGKGGDTHPKRLRNPNVSTMTPTNGHLKNTRRMPPMKHTVPRSFCFRAKK